MYRIRRSNGSEVTLASLDELAAAIAANTVTPDAEIHHQRADRWLPIASHPHFRLASDRARTMERPAPRTVPAPPAPSADAPRPAPPPLRLVRPEAPSGDGAPAAPRPAPRWTPPARTVAKPAPKPTPRPGSPSGSLAAAALQAVDPSPEPSIEFVVDAAEPSPEATVEPSPATTAEQPVRPRRVEQATAGLPLLDVDEPALPAPVRQPVEERPAVRPAPRAQVPTPVAVPQPERPAPPTRAEAPSFAALATAAASPAPVTTVAVVADAPALVDSPLDLPPAVTDFAPADTAAPAPAQPRSSWLLGAVAAVTVLAAIAFLALRPRSTTEPLDPARTPVTTATSTPTAPAAAPNATAEAAPIAKAEPPRTRPAITPDVPDAPSASASSTGNDTGDGVVPAAPVVPGFVPDANLAKMAPAIDIDPLAARKQQSLEATRQKIDSQMRQPSTNDE